MKLVWVVWVLLRTAWRGLRTSPVTAVVAAITIAVALVLVGSFALLVSNMQGMLERFGQELQVVAYLEPELSADAQRALASTTATIEGVDRVTWVSSEEALTRFRDRLGGEGLLEGLDDNPLPASLEIELRSESRNAEGLAIVEEALSGLPGIDQLADGQEWIEGYARALAFMRSAAYGLGAVLCLAALLIVANTIRLAIYAREDELEILSLVGASRSFVRIPFLLEGTLQGALGGVIALALLYLGFLAVVPQIQEGLQLFVGHSSPTFFAGSEIAGLIGGGAGLGFLGSFSALLGWRW